MVLKAILYCVYLQERVGTKNPQVHLIIKKELPKNTLPILRNLGNFPPGAFYSIPSTIRH